MNLFQKPDGARDYGAAMKVVEQAAVKLGHDRICPESLQAISDEAEEWGWSTFGIEGLRMAYFITMEGFRALFAPVGG